MRERATTLVAMSTTIGSASGSGNAAPIGLVPSSASFEPVGAMAGEALVKAKPISPCRAARSE